MWSVRGNTSRMTGEFWFIIVDERDNRAEGSPLYDDHDDAQAAANELNAETKAKVLAAWGEIVNYIDGQDDLDDEACEAMDTLHDFFGTELEEWWMAWQSATTN